MNRLQIRYLCRLLVAVILLSGLNSETYYTPVSHSVYRLLDYLSAAGYIAYKHTQLPFTRTEVAGYLNEALRQSTSGTINKSVQRYLREFDDYGGTSEGREYPGEYHTVRYAKNDMLFLGDLILNSTATTLTEQKPYFRFEIGGNIRGRVNSALTFQTNITSVSFWGNLDLLTGYDIDQTKEPVIAHHTEKQSSLSAVTSQVIGEFKWGHVSFGNDNFRWGPGRTGNLLLNNSAYSLPNVHALVKIGIFQYSKVYGILDKRFPDYATGEKIYQADQRKFVAHRVDVYLGPKIQFGIAESIVYNRETEFSYLNPLLPFTVSELQTGDKDNNLAAVDLSYQYRTNAKIYTEILIDDITLTQNLFSYFGNKWGLLVGHQWAKPFSLPDHLLTFEVVRLEPWVYSHRDSANIYEYYGKSIGYDLEPNSLAYKFNWLWFTTPALRCELQVDRILHGVSDRNFGVADDTVKEFLAGDIETSTMIQLRLEYEFFQNMWIKLELSHLHISNEKIDDTFDLFDGNRSLSGIRFGIDLNY